MRSFAPLLAAVLLAGAASAARGEEAAFDKFPVIADYALVKEVATLPPRPDAVVIDSRPAKGRYDLGHIPGAINISDSAFDKNVDKLPADKSKLLVFYCGGLACPLSHSSAFKAEKLGYANVKVYAAGMPDWEAKGELVAVSLAFVKGVIDKPDGTVLIDSRPKKRFDEGSIPGAINIPDTSFDKQADLLPADKKTPLVFFCGGLACPLSSSSALKARALGYTDVRVFPAGEPAWTEAYGAKPVAAAASAAGPAAKPAAGVPVAAGGETVEPDGFVALLASNPGAVHVFDVRDAKEYDRGHFATARNLPINMLEKQVDTLPADKPIVFVCATGARSSEAFDMVKLLRPDLKAYYLDADVTYNADGTQVVKGRVKK
ncbi:MAG: rhodanese-like domain-containing protein [Actinomycetota bacterium]